MWACTVYFLTQSFHLKTLCLWMISFVTILVDLSIRRPISMLYFSFNLILIMNYDSHHSCCTCLKPLLGDNYEWLWKATQCICHHLFFWCQNCAWSTVFFWPYGLHQDTALECRCVDNVCFVRAVRQKCFSQCEVLCSAPLIVLSAIMSHKLSPPLTTSTLLVLW